MVGQNFFNYIEFMGDKLLLYAERVNQIKGSALTGFANIDSNPQLGARTWAVNYRERPNDVTITNDFIFQEERLQRWSQWKYGMPTEEVSGLEYIPRKQPEFQYLGRSYQLFPASQRIRFNTDGQKVLKIALSCRDLALTHNSFSPPISDRDLTSSGELRDYFIFKHQEYRPLMILRINDNNEYFLENEELYSTEDIELSKDFKYPKITWGDGNIFKLYYDTREHPDYPLLPPKIITKVKNNYKKPSTRDFLMAYDIVNKSTLDRERFYIYPDLNTIRSLYLTSDNNKKIFEIAIRRYRLAFFLRNGKVLWRIGPDGSFFTGGAFARSLLSRVGHKKPLSIKSSPKADNFVSSLGSLERENINRSPEAAKFVSTLAFLEHTPDFVPFSYIEPFIFQPGVLPVNKKWQASQLEETGGFQKGISPKAVTRDEDGNINYQFDYQIVASGGNLQQMPNAENKSSYFTPFNLVPSEELVL